MTSRTTAGRSVPVAWESAAGEDVRSVRTRLFGLLQSADAEHGAQDHYLELVGASFLADQPTILGAVNEDWVSREHDWYMSMDRSVHGIPGGAPAMWRAAADEDGLVNSNYGHLLFSGENGYQFESVVSALIADPLTRQAVAVYTRPSIHVDSRVNGMSDFMCTSTVQYLIRDGQLETVVVMRSNDIVHGYRNDRAWQCTVRGMIIDALAHGEGLIVKPGGITWQVGSLHLYPRHTRALRHAIATGQWDAPLTAWREAQS